MLCQNCGKNHVTTHIQKNINGKTETYALCSQCAKSLGISAFAAGDFFSALFSDTFAPAAQEQRCKSCGCSFEEIRSTGKVGCADCYSEFYDKLIPSLQRIHGKSRHVGKIPTTASSKVKKEHKLEQLKKELHTAISSEAFEKAAEIRDQIRHIETEEGE